MNEQLRPRSRRMFWTVLALTGISGVYIIIVLVNLFNEANMAFGLFASQKQGIEQELTARELPFSDTTLSARQVSTMLLIAEDVTALPSVNSLASATRRVLVQHLNAASMTLREYRSVRSRIGTILSEARTSAASTSLEPLGTAAPRFMRVRTFFTKHLDTAGLTSTL